MKYGLMFGRTPYVKRMSNLMLSKVEEDGHVELLIEFLLEGVSHSIILYEAERIHRDLMLPVEEYTPDAWDALCQVFDQEVEAHVQRQLRVAHEAGKTTWEVYQIIPKEEEVQC
jgi:hypothetical protein